MFSTSVENWLIAVVLVVLVLLLLLLVVVFSTIRPHWIRRG